MENNNDKIGDENIGNNSPIDGNNGRSVLPNPETETGTEINPETGSNPDPETRIEQSDVPEKEKEAQGDQTAKVETEMTDDELMQKQARQLAAAKLTENDEPVPDPKDDDPADQDDDDPADQDDDDPADQDDDDAADQDDDDAADQSVSIQFNGWAILLVALIIAIVIVIVIMVRKKSNERIESAATS